MTCCDTLPSVPSQTMFLGCSISNFTASHSWGAGQSDLSVELREDSCEGYRVFWNENLNAVSGNYADFGFFGEDRYERTNGTQYSSCIKESPSDTLIRSAIDLVGMPVFFRIGTFELAGLLSDWTRTNSPTDAPSYRVKIVDPRLILEGVQLIIGDYTGAVNGTIAIIDGGTGEPQTLYRPIN